MYLLKSSTSTCQVKCDFVEKRRSYRLFNMTAYRFCHCLNQYRLGVGWDIRVLVFFRTFFTKQNRILLLRLIVFVAKWIQ